MAYQGYIDNMLIASGNVKDAMICDEENIVAQSDGFDVESYEIRDLWDGFSNPAQLHMTGFSVAGETYVTIRADGKTILGDQGVKGIAIAKAGRYLIIGTSGGMQQVEDCAMEVEKVRDYLEDVK